MSKNKEKLNDAFADVESHFIQATAYPPVRQRGWMRIAVIAACIAIIVASIPVSMLISKVFDENQVTSDSVVDLGNDTTPNINIPSYLGWEVLSGDASTAVKKKTGSQGTEYTFYADCGKVQNADFDARGHICTDMFGQWALSMSMYDCEMHYELFDKAFFTEYLCTEFDRYGLSIDQSAEVITRKAAELIPFDSVRVDFVISDIITDDSSVRSEFVESQAHFFEGAGLDIELVDEVIKYCFDSVIVRYDEFFHDMRLSEMFFYRCGDEWYIAPQNLEDDISIDVLHANKEENSGYFEVKTSYEIVQSIENGFVFIDDGIYSIKKCFAVTSDISHISVGDRVVIKHYTGISFGVKSIGDNNEYEFCVVVSIELRDHNHGYTN